MAPLYCRSYAAFSSFLSPSPLLAFLYTLKPRLKSASVVQLHIFLRVATNSRIMCIVASSIPSALFSSRLAL